MIHGHERPVQEFLDAWRGKAMHHAWLIGGPRGIGKATFAVAAAKRILAEAAGQVSREDGLIIAPDLSTARFIEGEAHPDFRYIERLPNKTGTALARNIAVDQIRELAGLFESTPALSDWRVAVIDSVDDLESGAANALLKMLEEPPPNCLFLLVSHVPGRLLPTIRSRCRSLVFQALEDGVMASILTEQMPDMDQAGRPRLMERAGGSAGRAIALATLDLAPIQEEAVSIMREGDPTNARRSKLSQTLSAKASSDRYAAFLEIVPSLIAGEARRLEGDAQMRALKAYSEARELTRMAPRLSLDAATTAFRLGSILASVAPADRRV